MVPAWEGEAAAWASLEALAVDRPLDGEVVAWCRLVAGNRGDEAAIARFGRWAEINTAPSMLPPFARVTTTAQTTPPSVFNDYSLLYRRPVPADQIVAVLPHLAWRERP